MRAVRAIDGVPTLVEVPSPPVRPGQIRIAVRAAGVNRADLVQAAGHYPPPNGVTDVLGLECAGTVAELAPGVTGWSVGDPVCALLAGGGYAEEVVVDARHVLPLPTHDPIEAAAVVEVFATAWHNLFRLAQLPPSARILLHAGASGVGTAAIQLARLRGHRTFVTAGSSTKIDQCIRLGADGGADRHDGPWLDAVRRWAPDGVHGILDPVGADYLRDNVAALAPDGWLVAIGLLSGRKAELDLGRLLVKRLHLVGSTLRARDAAFKADLITSLRQGVWPAFATGDLQPIVHATFPLQQAAQAHALLASNTTVGSVVLTL